MTPHSDAEFEAERIGSPSRARRVDLRRTLYSFRHAGRGIAWALSTQANLRVHFFAAAVVLMEKSAAMKKGLKPMARLIAYGHAGVDPKIMGLGPVSAVKSALGKAGLKLDQMDVIESNEAFAAQAMGVSKELGMNPAKVNPNGGAVAMGHPIGATGCILTIKAVYELQRTNGRYGLITMCIGGGQGIAAVIERM